jgi:DNA repair protein RadC
MREDFHTSTALTLNPEFNAFTSAVADLAAADRSACARPAHATQIQQRSPSMPIHAPSVRPPERGRCVRELVCRYRPLRDDQGRIVQVPSIALSDPRTAATTLAPLLADEPVEVFAVACLSTRHRLLTWHVLSRGTRSSTPVSLPDVFLPACLTPGSSALIVVHNHPSGDPTPSADDARLTLRLCAAADILDLPLLDHLIVGDAGRYYSFREAGVVAPSSSTGDRR